MAKLELQFDASYAGFLPFLCGAPPIMPVCGQ